MEPKNMQSESEKAALAVLDRITEGTVEDLTGAVQAVSGLVNINISLKNLAKQEAAESPVQPANGISVV